MKACYGRLHVPNVMNGHLWTPDKLKALTPNGDLYLQATSPLLNTIDDVKGESGTSNDEQEHFSNKGTSDTSDNTSMDEEVCGYCMQTWMEASQNNLS